MKISLLVPFRPNRNSKHRLRSWKWLHHYWMHELPDAEIIVGHSCSEIFSKSEAINDAAARATGDIFVIIDSDCYLDGATVLRAAAAIEEGRALGHKVWFMPYRHLYRLTEKATKKVLCSDPAHPYRFSSPPDDADVESTVGSEMGHYFGAMVQIMPREAFETVGCWDPRFKGWGSEDISFLLAVDTLWGKHKSLDATVFHLWHPVFKSTGITRFWEGQTENTHGHLGARYRKAYGDLNRMRALVDEGCSECTKCGCSLKRVFVELLQWFLWAFVALAFILFVLMK